MARARVVEREAKRTQRLTDTQIGDYFVLKSAPVFSPMLIGSIFVREYAAIVDHYHFVSLDRPVDTWEMNREAAHRWLIEILPPGTIIEITV